MANGPTLPPQAYTREILAVAFQWLQGQPESIKKLAQSPDALVGLYLRAQRFGNAAPETDAPVTSQMFISDLKNLAEGLKQFEEPVPQARMEPSAPVRMEPPAPAARSMPAAASRPAAAARATLPPRATPTIPPAAASMSTANGAGAWAASQSETFLSSALAPAPDSPADGLAPAMEAATAELPRPLNAASQTMIREVKTALNLSSDAEVLNMMVAIAYKSVRNLLA